LFWSSYLVPLALRPIFIPQLSSAVSRLCTWHSYHGAVLDYDFLLPILFCFRFISLLIYIRLYFLFPFSNFAHVDILCLAAAPAAILSLTYRLSGVPQGTVLGPQLYLLFTADIPTRHDTIIATFADDTAILASNPEPYLATQILQQHLDHLAVWLRTWRITVNETKSTQVTFTNRTIDCPPVTINNAQLPIQTEVKYLRLTLDLSLNLRPHISKKKAQINLKLQQMHWLIGRKSNLSIHNKLLLYKAIIKPIWTYGIQLWGCTKPSNSQIIQRVQ